MRQVIDSLTLDTPGPGLVPISAPVTGWLSDQPIRRGLLTLLVQHTSASLTIQENADPDVLRDLQDAVAGLAPHGGRDTYRHASEGPDDMAAHIRTVLSGVHLAIPVQGGHLMLGTWQGLYLWEHRDRGRRREIALHLVGEE
ncbi:MAG: secondary thiamine-phosphate synthase enzyme YjbQ [Pseudomonadota bacterium]